MININFRIYGVSHIVYSANNLKDTKNYFLKIGYMKKGEKQNAYNAIEKNMFVSGVMAETSDMILMTHPDFPDIEIKRENISNEVKTYSAYDFFILECCHQYGMVPELIAKSLSDTSNVIGGFNIFVRCDDVKKATMLWAKLKINVIIINNLISLVEVKNNFSRKRVTILYYKSPVSSPLTWLDQNNIVCLSLLCGDVDLLRNHFIKQKYVVGDIFEMCPFGKRLKVFFIRNFTGEIYEFVSPIAG